MAKKITKTELTDEVIKDVTKKTSATKSIKKSPKATTSKSKTAVKASKTPTKVESTTIEKKVAKPKVVKKTSPKKVVSKTAKTISKVDEVKIDDKVIDSKKVEEKVISETKTTTKKKKPAKKTKANQKAEVKSTEEVKKTESPAVEERKLNLVLKADLKPEIKEEVKENKQVEEIVISDTKTSTKKKKPTKKTKATKEAEVKDIEEVKKVESPAVEERKLNLVLKTDLKPEIKEEVKESKKVEEKVIPDVKTSTKKKKPTKKTKATKETEVKAIEEVKKVESPAVEERKLNLVLKADLKPEIKEEVKESKKVEEIVISDTKTSTKKKKPAKKTKANQKAEVKATEEVKKVESPAVEERKLNLVLKADLKPEIKEEVKENKKVEEKVIPETKTTTKKKKPTKKTKANQNVEIKEIEQKLDALKIEEKKLTLILKADMKANAEVAKENKKVEKIVDDNKENKTKVKAKNKTSKKIVKDVEIKEIEQKLDALKIEKKKLNLVLKADLKANAETTKDDKKVDDKKVDDKKVNGTTDTTEKKAPIKIVKASDRFKPVPLRIYEDKKSNQNVKNQNNKKSASQKKGVHILKLSQKDLLTAKQKRESYYKNLFAEINEFITKDLYIDNDIKIVVGVSGGCDSIVLLDILANLSLDNKYTLFIAHFDHSLRKESPQDLEFVKEMAFKYNIKFFSKKENVKEYAMKRSFSVEEAARNLRYEFFEEIAEEVDANFVALAHNANDSTETFFINLLRGSGLSGLSGIPIKRSLNQNVNVIRPIMNLSRKQVEEYASKRGLKWIEDQSNKQNIYLRNKIRNELLPYMQELFDRDIVQSVNKASKLINSADVFIYHKVKKYVQEVILEKKTSYVEIDLVKLFLYDDFVKAEIIGLILKNNFNFNNLSQNIVKGILSLYNSEPGASFAINDMLTVYKDRDTIFIARNQLFRTNSLVIDNIGEFKFENKIFKLSKCPKTKVVLGESENIEYFDLDYMPDKLEIRHIQDGDKFTPIGMTGRIKINDFLTNNKIPLLKKKDILVLTDRVNIIWLCQHRIADQYKITDSTQKVLKIEMIEKK